MWPSQAECSAFLRTPFCICTSHPSSCTHIFLFTFICHFRFNFAHLFDCLFVFNFAELSFWVSDPRSCLDIGSEGVYCIVRLGSSSGEITCIETSTLRPLSYVSDPESLASNPDAVHRVLRFRSRQGWSCKENMRSTERKPNSWLGRSKNKQ